ncbi:endonuclease/exonuclease/phosphatase family protein [Patescibacteria group bacterium]|nr:endonuclease/exonuclease/phosphatase family protein [Patescibacteria group bacterium]
MKLITLNTWGGIVFQPLMDFIKKHSVNTDIFCFQEMLFGPKPQFTPVNKARENLFTEISAILPDFVAYKHIPASDHFAGEIVNFGTGQAIFVKNTIKVINNGAFKCYDKMFSEIETLQRDSGRVTGNVQHIDLEIGNQIFSILNFHGLWQKNTHKADTAERLRQSEIIKTFLNSKNNKKILCGDFNLKADGQSIKILEQGLVNLVKKYNVLSTRSKFYTKEEKMADYIIVSPDIEVNKFKVFSDDISDHLPLLVEFK